MSHFIEEEPRVPEPALVRGAIMSVTSLIAIIFNIKFELGWVDSVLAIYAVMAPIIAGILIRRKVTPTNVVDFKVKRALYTEPPKAA